MTCASLTLERALFALAGSMTLVAALLTVLVSPWFVSLAVFVGLNQLLFTVAGNCPASLVLRRVRCLSQEAVR